MTKQVKQVKKVCVLTSCTKCEYFETKPVPCPDSFCRPEEWSCKKKKGLVIDGYHEWHDKDPGIPKKCPLEDYKETKK